MGKFAIGQKRLMMLGVLGRRGRVCEGRRSKTKVALRSEGQRGKLKARVHTLSLHCKTGSIENKRAAFWNNDEKYK